MAASPITATRRRWVQATNDRDWLVEASCRAPEFVAHLPGVAGDLDNSGWRTFLSNLTRAFPDAQISIESSIAERDVVASRWTLTGTHQCDFLGAAASGRQVQIRGLDFTRVVDGRITEHWALLDLLGLLQQIGATPVRC
jgi:steroid delta-isomerase-like uncharacterized protein